jgi:hypothetical protein
MPRPGFEPIDWTAPIDVDEYINACPPENKVKGVIVLSIMKQLTRKGIKPPAGMGPYQSFKDYSLREHMKITVDVAKMGFPNQSLRESLRQLGWETFPAVKETLLGKVVFGAFDDPKMIFKFINKSYEIVGSGASGRVVDQGPRFVHTHTKNAYGFLDTFHAGTAEGTMRALGKNAALTIKRHSISEAEFFLEW